jgi:uncharacterized protein with PQ loop repeat
MFEFWMVLIGLSMAASSVPQIVRLIQQKKSTNVSLPTWITVLHAELWWLAYGIYLASTSLIVTNILCIILNSWLVYLVIKYRESKQITGDLYEEIGTQAIN